MFFMKKYYFCLKFISILFDFVYHKSEILQKEMDNGARE